MPAPDQQHKLVLVCEFMPVAVSKLCDGGELALFGPTPAMRQQVIDRSSGVRVDADQYVTQVRDGINVVKVTGRDERV